MSTPNTSLVERMARAIADEDGANFENWLPMYTAQALAALKAMREPTTEQKRGLLRHRGFDPDANESTLDTLGKLEIATMGIFLAAYTAMIDAALQEHEVSK